MKAALLITSGLFLLAAFAGQPPQPVANSAPAPAVDHSAELAKLQAQLNNLDFELATAKSDLAAANGKLAKFEQQAKTEPPLQAPQHVAYGGSCASGSCSLGSRYVSTGSGGGRPRLFGRLRARRGR